MTIFVCPWKCGLRLMSSGLIPKSEMRGFWGSWCYFILHIEGNFGCLSCCQFICLHEISSHHQGSEQFGLSKVLDEHEDLIISPLTEDSQGKKKNFSRKNFLSENSWFSLWILFPRGWLFQHRARRHYSPGPNFPTQGKAKRSLLRAQGVEKQRFPCRTQAISCTEWIFCSVCWAEIKEHAGDLTALSSSSTNVLLQDLKTVLKDLLSFPKRIVSPQLVGGWLLRWGRSQKDK